MPQSSAEKARLYRMRHPEKTRESARRSAEKHKDKRAAYAKARYHADREGALERSASYRAANREKLIAQTKAWRAALKAEMHAAYGNRCKCCDETEARFLTLEHVGQTGGEHRRKLGGQAQIYSALKKQGWPQDGYTLLCWNCNLATRDGSPCPHVIARQALRCDAA